jgi:hypothetical protein
MENIGSFALYKNFTLFEIVNELVSKEEPLYFNPPTLQETLRNPNPRKEAHQIQRECNKEYRFHFKSFTNFFQGTDNKDLRVVVDNLVSLAQSDKLYIKSITEAELKDINTAAECMLHKDDYKAAEEG